MKKQNIIGKIALLFAFAFIFTSVAYNLSIPVGARAAEVGADTPGGVEITMALLVVSGLLAIASFIAFLISLSAVRNIPSKKDKDE